MFPKGNYRYFFQFQLISDYNFSLWTFCVLYINVCVCVWVISIGNNSTNKLFLANQIHLNVYFSIIIDELMNWWTNEQNLNFDMIGTCKFVSSRYFRTINNFVRCSNAINSANSFVFSSIQTLLHKLKRVSISSLASSYTFLLFSFLIFHFNATSKQ